MGLRDRFTGAVRQAAGLARDALDNFAPEPGNVPPAWQYDGTQEQIEKAQKADARKGVAGPPVNDPAAMFFDPFSIIEAIGYKDRPSSITYSTLGQMTWRVPTVQAVLQTRLAQIRDFCRPQRNRHDNGFKIRMRDPDAKMTAAAAKRAREIEEWIMTTGYCEDTRTRDNFGVFMTKIGWDSLVYDQACFEIIPDRKGRPSQFYAVDASTMRLADRPDLQLHQAEMSDRPHVVQIFDGTPVRMWPMDQMAFCVRNPRTSVKQHGYGTSELEMLIQVITAMLWAFQYNEKFFSQGTAPKGVLNLKGTIPERQLQAFRRLWYQMVSGVENAWRTPVLNSDQGVEWVNMQQTNRDMEYSSWMDHLIKLTCSVYLMDPAEVGFNYGQQGQQKSMFEASNKQKIVDSRDKGLKPLMRSFEDWINNHLITPVDEDFAIRFLGLDAQTPMELAELQLKRSQTTWTIDELRAEDDKPPLPDGEGAVILSPTWMQFKQAKDAMAQEGAMGEGGEDGGGAGPDVDGDGDAEGQEDGSMSLEALLGGMGGGQPKKPAETTEKSLITIDV